MMPAWNPLVDVLIVAVVGLAAWVSYALVRGEETRRDLTRKAADPAHWPTTKRWDGDDL